MPQGSREVDDLKQEDCETDFFFWVHCIPLGICSLRVDVQVCGKKNSKPGRCSRPAWWFGLLTGLSGVSGPLWMGSSCFLPCDF